MKGLNLTKFSVRTKVVCMKNITLSAHESLIDAGRKVAMSRKTTLNALFREWLSKLGEGELREQAYLQHMDELSKHVRVGGRKFTREEMNEH